MDDRMKRNFQDKVVVVIGGASGIGAALCRLLAEEHATIIVADLNLPRAQELARELGKSASAFEVNTVVAESVHALIASCLAVHGAIHLLINSAGVLTQGAAEDFTDAEWSRVLNINLRGTVTTTMAAYRLMLDQGFGQIVNIASLSGLNGNPFSLPYVTSKCGVVGLSIALRAEAQAHGVEVSVVCPGNVATPMISAVACKPSRLTPTISVQRAAAEILRGIRCNRSVIVFPAYARILWRIERFAPWLSAMLRNVIVAKANRRVADDNGNKPV
jgi:NAD(P)-dependent dehydrogenase (short-subunit alcohol dehydrogenase family)